MNVSITLFQYVYKLLQYATNKQTPQRTLGFGLQSGLVPLHTAVLFPDIILESDQARENP